MRLVAVFIAIFTLFLFAGCANNELGTVDEIKESKDETINDEDAVKERSEERRVGK